jgi:hypothetical protein
LRVLTVKIRFVSEFIEVLIKGGWCHLGSQKIVGLVVRALDVVIWRGVVSKKTVMRKKWEGSERKTKERKEGNLWSFIRESPSVTVGVWIMSTPFFLEVDSSPQFQLLHHSNQPPLIITTSLIMTKWQYYTKENQRIEMEGYVHWSYFKCMWCLTKECDWLDAIYNPRAGQFTFDHFSPTSLLMFSLLMRQTLPCFADSSFCCTICVLVKVRRGRKRGSPHHCPCQSTILNHFPL